MPFQIDQFDYTLPKERIAQVPAKPRDSSRLLDLDRNSGEMKDLHFSDLPSLLDENTVIVRNNTKVIPARLFGKKITGGQCELLLIKLISHDSESCVWECLSKPGLKENQQVLFPNSSLIAICTQLANYTRILKFNLNLQDFYLELYRLGSTPIPPYISWEEGDEERLRTLYQTTYAKISGSAAAPTAGLHFTPELDQKLQKQGVEIIEVTLHVGLGTFLPLQPEQIASGKLHEEIYQVTPEVAEKLNSAKAQKKKIIAVGTTTTRLLETVGTEGVIKPGSGKTDIFIQPGFTFNFVDAMITNFHLPKSSLLMLISAFTSEPNTQHGFTTFAESNVGRAYLHAVESNYRFFSFGDAMFIH